MATSTSTVMNVARRFVNNNRLIVTDQLFSAEHHAATTNTMTATKTTSRLKSSSTSSQSLRRNIILPASASSSWEGGGGGGGGGGGKCRGWDSLLSSAFVVSTTAVASMISPSTTTFNDTAAATSGQEHHVPLSFHKKTNRFGGNSDLEGNSGDTASRGVEGETTIGDGGHVPSITPFRHFSFATAESIEGEEDYDPPLASSTHVTSRTYDVSVQALQGKRATMEDEYILANHGQFTAVFDGHGGGAVSAILKHRLYDEICHYLQQRHWEETENRGGKRRMFTPSLASHAKAIRDAFKVIDADILQDDTLRYVGSTAVAVIVHESDDGLRTLLSANIGDSRAVLCRRGKAVELTRDHKPNDERERVRIQRMGGTIEWDKSSKVHRVRNLAVSRAVGDKHAKPTVTSEVEIKHFPLREQEDEFVVLASDGLWDVMSNQEVVNFVESHRKPGLADSSESIAENRKRMAGKLACEALKRGSGDNVCVILVWLKDESSA